MDNTSYHFHTLQESKIVVTDTKLRDLVTRFEGRESLFTRLLDPKDKTLTIFEVQPDIIIVKYHDRPDGVAYTVFGGSCSDTGKERRTLFQNTLKECLES